MMLGRLALGRLHILHGIVEKEVYQDGVHLRLRMLSQYLALDQLNAPDRASWVSLAPRHQKKAGEAAEREKTDL